MSILNNIIKKEIKKIFETQELNRKFIPGESKIPLAAPSFSYDEVEDALDSLCTQFTELKPNLFDEKGVVRNFINVYLNDGDIRYADGMKSAVKDGDSIQIVPSVAGGYIYSK